MLAKVIDSTTKEVSAFLGTDTEWAISQGYSEIEVEQAYDGNWYVYLLKNIKMIMKIFVISVEDPRAGLVR